MRVGGEKTNADHQTRRELEDFSVLLKGSRLQITANVDEAGLDQLIEVLLKHKEIMKMLQ